MAERPILGVGGQLQEGVKDGAVMHLDERTSARQAKPEVKCRWWPYALPASPQLAALLLAEVPERLALGHAAGGGP